MNSQQQPAVPLDPFLEAYGQFLQVQEEYAATEVERLITNNVATNAHSRDQNESSVYDYSSQITQLRLFQQRHYPEHASLLDGLSNPQNICHILLQKPWGKEFADTVKALAELSVAVSATNNLLTGLNREMVIQAIQLATRFTNPQNLFFPEQMTMLTLNLQAATAFVRNPENETRNKLMQATEIMIWEYDSLYKAHENRLLYGFAGAVALAVCVAAAIFFGSLLDPASIIHAAIRIPLGVVGSTGFGVGAVVMIGFLIQLSLWSPTEHQKAAYAFRETAKEVSAANYPIRMFDHPPAPPTESVTQNAPRTNSVELTRLGQ